MINELLRISSVSSEAWVAWLLLGMLVLALLNGLFISDISALLRGMFSKAERIYVGRHTQGIVQKVSSGCFRIGMLAMVGYLWFGQYELSATQSYWAVLMKVLVVVVAQWLLIKSIGWVFISPKLLANALEQRSVICNAAAVLLWPIALVMRSADMGLNIAMCGVLGAVYVIALCVKFMHLFFRDLLSVAYMLMYIVSLEIMPLGLVFFWVKNSIE